MTQEEKARAYDEALESIKKFLAEFKRRMPKDVFEDAKTIFEDNFPELAESEDERIRKAIIATIHLYYGEPLEDEAKDMIAWLEKQGEQKPIANVEPKFKVGDFIANDYCFGKVIEITNDAYLLDTEQGIPFSYEHNAHLWTIQDAKDGDVLASGHLVFIFKVIHGVWLNCHCSAHNDGSFIADSYDLMTNKYFSEVHPATKEQCDILFAKMKEAGYEWDAEKRELKKIEQKSKWSNEDEERLQSCIIELQGKGLMGGVDTTDTKWLKSLKQRIHVNSAKTCKNDTLLDLLNKMPSCITVDGLDYHFVMKKTSIYLAYYACYNGNGEEGRGNAIFGITAHSPIDLLTEMLEILKEKGLLE